MKKIRRLILAVLALVLSLTSANGDNSIPYAKLYDLFHRGAAINSPNVRPIFVVASKDSAVRPASITLTIQAKSGPIHIKIDPDGEIQGFPLTPALLSENPPVLTNQAKGTLMIGGSMGIVLPNSLTFTYQQLNDLVIQATTEMKKAAGFMLSFMVPKAKGLIFAFSNAHRQTLTIAYKDHPKVLQSNSEGSIIMPIDKTSVAENPTVTLSEKPLKVSVDM
jgi:hypothetical protein